MKLSFSATSVLFLSCASAFAPSQFRHSKIGIQSTLMEAANYGQEGKDDNDNDNDNDNDIDSKSFLGINNQNRRDLFKSIPSNAALLAALFGGVSASSFPSAAAAEDENLGILAGLVGKWQGDQGFVMISHPAPGAVPTSRGEFDIIQFTYREQFEIKMIGSALQRGGSIDENSGVCMYEKTVWETTTFPNDPSKQPIIHHENGMLFNLKNITANKASPDAKIPDVKYPIGRSASIPHGNNCYLFGTASTSSGPPSFGDISASASVIPTTNPRQFLGAGYMAPYVTPVRDAIAPKPLNTLVNALAAGPTIIETTHFDLDSQHGGGILNTEFIKKRADTKNYKADLW
eukprot:CAMPEP_0198277708 /NCGR_PEP_ID=MMETSP1447-20131203/65993_1 /TAXON_ID=420782 /ORGANISM="Chaetoceros dichaeta, Strain CCMP1751" /LENGTH=345 /DNA_ID=CAMNT_0043972751 /DNA_START=2068 /DNA_END=3102 /DNA_ORIENTATION=-